MVWKCISVSLCFRPVYPVGEKFVCFETQLPWEQSCYITSFKPARDPGDSCTAHAEWQIAVFFTMTICIFINTSPLQFRRHCGEICRMTWGMVQLQWQLQPLAEGQWKDQNTTKQISSSFHRHYNEKNRVTTDTRKSFAIQWCGNSRCFSLSGLCEWHTAPEMLWNSFHKPLWTYQAVMVTFLSNLCVQIHIMKMIQQHVSKTFPSSMCVYDVFRLDVQKLWGVLLSLLKGNIVETVSSLSCWWVMFWSFSRAFPSSRYSFFPSGVVCWPFLCFQFVVFCLSCL